ncbi:MAG: SGNH/GDSL hydrolase family protein [Pseudomonadota bacterium]
MKQILSGAISGTSRGIALAAALTLAAATFPACAQVTPGYSHSWVGTWGTAPAGPPLPAALQTFNDQTLRLIVHTSIGGTQVRVRLSNEFGAAPLRVGAARIALRQAGADINVESDRPLTFSGFTSVTIPAGAPMLSDPVELTVPPMSDLAVSIYLPGEILATTIHGSAYQTNYVSLPGNFTGASVLPIQRTIFSWPFITEVDVQSPARAVVALGDSITDGAVTTRDANHRWPDFLALRMQTTRELSALQTAHGGANELGIVNRGIGGNRLLRDPAANPLAGRSALARFDRDVIATAGVSHVVVLLGINDIGAPGTASTPADQAVTVEDLIAGYRQLIARAHAKGLTIYGGTMTPFEGTLNPGYFTPAKELIRQAANNWIRTSDEFDGVIDFDRAVRDPGQPSRFLPAFDSGDHLHPNDLGMQAMANAIPLDLFRGNRQVLARDLPARQ